MDITDNNSIYSISRWNGWNGNECVYKKDYNTAIQYYNTAIELFPSEYRYFVNRSYCFDQLKQFELALSDAQKALSLNSDWGKCHFRKARALKGLKRLKEAEVCFWKVIELEGKDCKEAQNELLNLRELALINAGIESRIASEVANQSTDINEAINTIKREFNKNIELEDMCEDKPKSNRIKKSNKTKSETKTPLVDSFSQPIQWSCRERNLLKSLSDFLLNTNNNLIPNQSEDNSKSVQRFQNDCLEKSEQKCRTNDNKSIKSFSSESNQSKDSKPKPGFHRRNGRKCMDQMVEIWDESNRDPNHCWSSIRSNNINSSDSIRKSEPTNPWRFKGLWVSNIIPSEQTIKILRDILSEFGKITLINLIPESETAVINFDNCESPRIAMSRLQGVYMPNICIQNEKLRIKFRPLIDSKNYPSISCATDRQLNNECYFWRTTGCSYLRYCKLKHIPANKGVDLQPWMQSLKSRYKRQHRQ